MENKKKIVLLILAIAVLLAFAYAGKKVNQQYWICPTDYTEITFSGGVYYYRSEADNFYLYSVDEKGQYPKCIVRQVPKEIYVVGDWVYFTNLSDGSKLYRVKTDGSGLEVVCARKISRFFPIGNQFYCLSHNQGEDEIFICTQGGKLQTVYKGECDWISTDGEFLYLDLRNEEEKVQYRTVAMNRNGEVEKEYEIHMRDLIPTDKYLYYSEKGEIIRLDKNTGKKVSLKIPDFLVEGPGEFRYVTRDEDIFILLLGKNGDREVYKVLKYVENKRTFEELYEETDLQGSISPWDRMKCIYLVNGNIFYKNFVEEGKGELWHMLDISGGVPAIFEKMEETVAVDTSLSGDFFYNGNREGFLEQDILYAGEQKDEAGNVIETTIVLPKISKDIRAADQINIKIKEEAEAFYEEQISYHENQKWNADDGINGSNGLLKCDYAYADENYISIVYRKVLWTNDGEYDMQEYVTRLYSSDTGEELKIEDLFKVKWGETVLRFSYLIRKTELSFNLFSDDFPLINGNYMRVYYCLTDTGVDIIFVDDIRTFKEYHFVLSYKELADILK